MSTVILFLLVSCFRLTAFAEEPITLHYVERGPYAVTGAKGEPEGLLIPPTLEIFNKAKVPFVWTKTPMNRQFVLMKENKARHCAIGLIFTESRAKYSKFTKPFYIGEPFIVIMNSKVKLKPRMTIVDMLKQYSILVKENLTMGDELTKKVLASPNANMTSVDSDQMVKMVSHGRADFMMISNEEVRYHLENGNIQKGTLKFRELDDVKIRFERSIMCSRSVSNKIIARLNAVIDRMDVQPAKYVAVH